MVTHFREHSVLVCTMINHPCVLRTRYSLVLDGRGGSHPSCYPLWPNAFRILVSIHWAVSMFQSSLCPQPGEVETLIFSIVWRRKLRLGEVMYITQGCPASEWQNWSVIANESSDGWDQLQILFCFFRRKYGPQHELLTPAVNISGDGEEKIVLSRKKIFASRFPFHSLLKNKTRPCFCTQL